MIFEWLVHVIRDEKKNKKKFTTKWYFNSFINIFYTEHENYNKY